MSKYPLGIHETVKQLKGNLKKHHGVKKSDKVLYPFLVSFSRDQRHIHGSYVYGGNGETYLSPNPC
jgi:hypothetical protein